MNNYINVDLYIVMYHCVGVRIIDRLEKLTD